jgi:hypothetical protein
MRLFACGLKAFATREGGFTYRGRSEQNKGFKISRRNEPLFSLPNKRGFLCKYNLLYLFLYILYIVEDCFINSRGYSSPLLPLLERIVRKTFSLPNKLIFGSICGCFGEEIGAYFF